MPPPLDPKDAAAISEFTPERKTSRGFSGQYSMTPHNSQPGILADAEEKRAPAGKERKAFDDTERSQPINLAEAGVTRDRFWLGIIIGLMMGLAIGVAVRYFM